MNRWLVALLAVFLIPCVNLRAEEDGGPARGKYSQATRAKFQAKDWSWLEKTAHEIRVTKAKFPEGLWKLPNFYNGLSPKFSAKSQKDWEAWFKKLDEWKSAYPASITQKVAHARAWSEYAWYARGGEWAHKVTEQGWEKFSERLAQARSVLEEADKLPEKCPEWFTAMQTVALGQGWERQEYEQLYRKAVAFEPTYYEIYFKKATYLQPKWFGREGEWQEFAEEAAREANPAEGLTTYTRTCWGVTSSFKNPFEEGQVDWQKMKQGFRDIEKRYPNSRWNLNHFCRFAVLAGDRATARELLARIGDKPSVAAWDTLGKFETARTWILGEKGVEPRAIYKASRYSHFSDLAYLPDGKHLAVSDSQGAVHVWDVTTDQIIWTAPQAQGALSVAFSPDGKLLAVSTGKSLDSTIPGKVLVYDFPEQTLRAEISEWKGPVSGVAFSRDGKLLVMAGGPFGKLGEARTWETATGKVTIEEREEPHTHSFRTVALSPDNRVMITDCGRTIDLFDIVENKSLLPTEQHLPQGVQNVAFSPDGRVLAAALAPGWKDRREAAGGIAFWDVSSWKKTSKPLVTPNGMLCVAFSPDSRWIAAGGYDSAVRVWEAATGKEVATFFGHTGQVDAITWSPDGTTLASASWDGTVRLWEAPRE